MTLTYRLSLLERELTVPVVQELEPVCYLRVFRRPNGGFLHVARWNVLAVDGVLQ